MASSSSHVSSSSGSGHHKHHQKGSDPDVVIAPATSTTTMMANQPNVISRRSLQLLAKYVDTNVLLDEETEDILLSYSDEFMEEVIEGACKLAAHRKANSVEPQDIETYLERNHNIWISSEAKEEPTKIQKRSMGSDAHKQRLALIKKTLKKY